MGVRQDTTCEKGTAVRKTYQRNEIDTPDGRELAVPEHVTVVMAEVAADMREGLLALAVGAGLQVMTALMDADVTAVAGPKGKHDPDRVAVRQGTERGSVTLGGRRVPIQQPGRRRHRGAADTGVRVAHWHQPDWHPRAHRQIR